VNVRELKSVYSMPKVEELTLRTKQIQQEVARWRKACEQEVEAGKSAIKELNQEVIQDDMRCTSHSEK
jgi:xylose isomerase